MIINELPTSKESTDEMVQYLVANLPNTYTLHATMLRAMWEAQALLLLVKRDDAKVITGIQAWVAVHNPLMGAKRMCKKIAECGDSHGFEAAQTMAFSMFNTGYELL